MLVEILESPGIVAQRAATQAAELMRAAIAERGRARVTAATGASQVAFLERLIRMPDVDWARVELFHLDEYIGLPGTHAASFQRYIRERIVEPAGVGRVLYLDGMRDPQEMCRIASQAVREAPIDVTFCGLGENGHLAFNEPPADFATREVFLMVTLDARTREQQVREGFFTRMEDVPQRAITMSIPQILASRAVLLLATGERKKDAVQRCFREAPSPQAPASALQGHAGARVYLDAAAGG